MKPETIARLDEVRSHFKAIRDLCRQEHWSADVLVGLDDVEKYALAVLTVLDRDEKPEAADSRRWIPIEEIPMNRLLADLESGGLTLDFSGTDEEPTE